jgi:translation initiation factor 2 alpha subunit (eIF-2alpha)
MKAAMQSMRSELDEIIRQRVENVMTSVNRETKEIQKRLTERIENTQVELQAAEVSVDTQARKLQENLEDIRADFITNLAMDDLGANVTIRETLAQQRIAEEKLKLTNASSRLNWKKSRPLPREEVDQQSLREQLSHQHSN